MQFATETPLWHTQMDKFAPRIGAVYQVHTGEQATVLRAGIGLSGTPANGTSSLL
jgi:hypothetical protein